jgi:hypothetical protein
MGRLCVNRAWRAGVKWNYICLHIMMCLCCCLPVLATFFDGFRRRFIEYRNSFMTGDAASLGPCSIVCSHVVETVRLSNELHHHSKVLEKARTDLVEVSQNVQNCFISWGYTSKMYKGNVARPKAAPLP